MKLILFVLIALNFNFAQAARPSDIGTAGCGLGNQLFKKDNQVLASTTNDWTGSQTFGISSGTSNCDADKRMAAMTQFIDTNRIALEKDAARGEGETVTSLSALLGCSENESVLRQELQSQYQTVFSASESKDVALRVKNLVKTSPTLRKRCNIQAS